MDFLLEIHKDLKPQIQNEYEILDNLNKIKLILKVSMIINNFLGGLGNQLFQIAAGYAHARRINKFAINYSLNHVGFGQDYHPENTDVCLQYSNH